MNKELESALTKYKEFTLELIKVVEAEDYDSIDILLDNKQQIIEKINCMEYSTEEFSLVTNKLELLTLEKMLIEKTSQKRSEAKGEINKISHVKNANNMYNKGIYNNSKVFSTKI